jgi:hypothetical protein
MIPSALLDEYSEELIERGALQAWARVGPGGPIQSECGLESRLSMLIDAIHAGGSNLESCLQYVGLGDDDRFFETSTRFSTRSITAQLIQAIHDVDERWASP